MYLLLWHIYEFVFVNNKNRVTTTIKSQKKPKCSSLGSDTYPTLMLKLKTRTWKKPNKKA